MLNLVLLSVIFGVASTQPGQQDQLSRLADSTAVQIMAVVRARGNNVDRGWVREILRQTQKSQPSAKLNEIGDSLALEIIGKTRMSPSSPGDRDYHSSYTLLYLSGRIDQGGGTPFAGALDRLLRIYREAEPTSMIRSGLTRDLLCTSDFTRGLDAMRDIAISTEWTAKFAMDGLITIAMTGRWCSSFSSTEQLRVKAVLRSMFDNRQGSGEAGMYLNAYAAREGWRR